MNIEIANRLVELRKKNNLSQEELAAKLGLSRQAVSKWERAEASPDTDNLICLAKIYGVSLDELLKTDVSEEEIAQDVRNHQAEEDGDEDDNDDDSSDAYAYASAGGKAYARAGGKSKMVHVDTSGKSLKRRLRFGKTFAVISSINVFVITIAYIVLGFFLPHGEGWRVYWTLFILIPVIESLLSAIKMKNASHFAYPVLMAFIYLFIGVKWDIWHPTWALFITIPIYYSVVGIARTYSVD